VVAGRTTDRPGGAARIETPLDAMEQNTRVVRGKSLKNGPRNGSTPKRQQAIERKAVRVQFASDEILECRKN